MKKCVLLGIATIAGLLLTACTNIQEYQAKLTFPANPIKETWAKQVDLSSKTWTRNADHWFFTGQPNPPKRYRGHCASTAVTMAVDVPDFSTIETNANVAIQLTSKHNHNSVFVSGPSSQVRQLSFEVRRNTLYINQETENQPPLRDVTVSIDAHELRTLSNKGAGVIEGRNLRSSNLEILSSGSGIILLQGNMNLTRVNHSGTGTITVIGAYTPKLSVSVLGKGNVNIGGRVGIQNLVHKGDGTVKIIGADTDGLEICTGGSGLTTLAGAVRLKRVSAFDCSRLYAYFVDSDNALIFARGNSRIGLAGFVKKLDVDMVESSRFEGRCLHATDANIHTRDIAHANITVNQKLFVAADDKSSIYYFGTPTTVARYSSRGSAILDLGNNCPCDIPMPAFMPVQRKSFKGE